MPGEMVCIPTFQRSGDVLRQLRIHCVDGNAVNDQLGGKAADNKADGERDDLLRKLRRMQFGAKSERLPEEQLQLGLEALEQAIAKDEAEAAKQDPELRKDNAA